MAHDVDIGDDARSLIRRLAAIDRVKPTFNARLAEEALAEHFAQLDLPCPPIRWVRDAEEGWSCVIEAARSAARSAAWSAARSAARSAAWSAAESAAWSAAESAAFSTALPPATGSPADYAAGVGGRAASEAMPPALARWIGIWLPFLQ